MIEVLLISLGVAALVLRVATSKPKPTQPTATMSNRPKGRRVPPPYKRPPVPDKIEVE